jgi:2-methylisocitrate lyase-like PEP mutase family enzyme
MAYNAFEQLHHGDLPFVLPNAWDVPSAVALVSAGFTAIGTTSFGVAATHGSPDGGRTTARANLALAEALRPLDALLSFDVEDGYSDDPDEVAAYVARLRVHGVNLEDSTAEHLVEPDRHAAKIAAVKEQSPDVFVNARIDNYWLGQQELTVAVLDRARRYVAAGADGIFVPGLSDPAAIATIAEAVDRPLNILAIPGWSLPDLGKLGVRRVSTGSYPYRAAVTAAVTAAVAFTTGENPPDATPYAAMQADLVEYAKSRS